MRVNLQIRYNNECVIHLVLYICKKLSFRESKSGTQFAKAVHVCVETEPDVLQSLRNSSELLLV